MSLRIESIKVIDVASSPREANPKGTYELQLVSKNIGSKCAIQGIMKFIPAMKKVKVNQDSPEEWERKRREAIAWMAKDGAYDYKEYKEVKSKYGDKCAYCNGEGQESFKSGGHSITYFVGKVNGKELIFCNNCYRLLFEKGVHCWHCKKLELWVEGSVEGDVQCDCILKHTAEKTKKGCLDYIVLDDKKAPRDVKVYPEGSPPK